MKPAAFVLRLLAGLALAAATASAQPDTNGLSPQVLSLVNHLHYQQGVITLPGGLAKLTVPPEFNYLDAADAATVLVTLWGNPPADKPSLGLLIPAGLTPLSTNCWVVTLDYDADGHVNDNDAAKINYDTLLKQMQQAVVANNAARRAKGYPTAELLGWAAPPRYDAAAHKLYWAKRFQFAGEPAETLNYNIRILGRKGVLELNAIASMDQLAAITAQTQAILDMVNFQDGNRYADFDPKVDEVAKYGLAALVAGGTVAAAAKLGLLKLLWVGILAAKKFIILGLAALAAFFKRLFNRKSDKGGV